MSQTFVVASRELAEKRFVLYAAIAIAVLSVLVPLVPGVSVHNQPRDIITAGSLILATLFTLAISAILGASIVGRDVAAGRMSFFFARPVTASSIWFGKILAALLLIFASFLIVIAPAYLAGTPPTRVWSSSLGALLAGIAVAAVVVFFGAHAVGTMVRSRSGLIAADFVAAAAATAIVWLMTRPLAEAGAHVALQRLLLYMLLGALAVAIAAGAWQLADGRGDRRRSHAAFSKAFWSGIGVVVLLGAGFVGWILSAGPRDILRAGGRGVFDQPGRGTRAILAGDVPHRYDYRPTFLIDPRTGQSQRLPEMYWQGQFSKDGTKLLALASSKQEPGPSRVVVRDVATGRETDTHLLAERWWSTVGGNDDFSRIAIANGSDGLVTVVDVATGRSLMSARMPRPRSLFFVAPDLLRAYVVSNSRPCILTAYEIDVAHHAVRQTGELTWNTRSIFTSANPDGSRLVLHSIPEAWPSIVDARTLQPVAPLAGEGHVFPSYLSDGRIVMGNLGPRAVLTVLSPDGTSKQIDLGPGVAPQFLRELAPGKIVVRTGDQVPPNGHSTSVVVDVDRGVVLRSEPGVVLSQMTPPVDSRPFLAGADCFLSTRTGVVRWNALTGEKKPLI